MNQLNPEAYRRIVFFTGAGMSAESGVPTYRGQGGVWAEYRYEDYACQAAFDRDSEKVMQFHELRRQQVLKCHPHAGHEAIRDLEKIHTEVAVVTQNIDGMHQRAGSRNVIELHGSLWRVRCPNHGVTTDLGETFSRRRCPQCGTLLRPDIVWFGDSLDQEVMRKAMRVIAQCDLLISIGTSGVVWPAAGFPEIARKNRARCVEINPETTPQSALYDERIPLPAGKALPLLFSMKI